MKKTQFLELIRIIRKTLVSFIAIVMFVAMAMALFTGLGWCSTAFDLSVNRYFDDCDFHDVQILFPYGFSAEDAAELLETDGVDAVEGRYNTFQYFKLDGLKTQARIISLPREIDCLSQIEGVLPVKAGEIAFEKFWAVNHHIAVGDTVTFEHDEQDDTYFLPDVLSDHRDRLTGDEEKSSPDGMKYLVCDSFTVTALVETPEYMSRYPESYGASSSTFTPINCICYTAEASFDAEAFCGYPCLTIRSDGLRGLLSSSEEYRSRSMALKERVTEAADRLAARKCLAIHEAGQRLTDDLEEELTDAGKDLKQAKRDLEDAEQELEDLRPMLPEEQLREQTDKLDDLRKELRDQQAEYDDHQDQLQELKDALADIRDYDSTVLIRSNNAGVSMIKILTDAYSDLRVSMALLFVVIGLLVSYSAVSRLVYEQSVLIGTKKALGLSDGEITAAYLAYSGLAAVIGCLFGVLGGYYVVEPLLVGVNQSNYLIGSTVRYLDWREVLVMSAVELGLILVSALIACRRTLKSSAVDLLTGRKQFRARERFFERFRFWKRLPLLSKTIINNFFNDGRRVFATVIGITGCTVLVVCAVTMHDCITQSLDVQYSRIQDYDTIVYVDSDADGAVGRVAERLEDRGIRYTNAFVSIGQLIAPDEECLSTYIVASDDERFGGFFRLYTPDGTPGELSDGIWISCAYADEYGLQAGDTVTLNDAEGQRHEITIGGVYEYYLMRAQLVMPMTLYRELFSEDAAYNAFLACTGDLSVGTLDAKLQDVEGYICTDDFYAVSSEAFQVLADAFLAVVAVYLVLSVLMAVLVLLNLLIMFVEEKKTELITMMINGFYRKDARRYIYSDTIFLTVISVLLGMAGGVYMGHMTVASVSNNVTYFYRADPMAACLIGLFSTVTLTVTMSCIALRRINRFKLTDINDN